MNNDQRQTKGFKFKQFAIEGGQCGMPVSTDGVLLGAWADIEHAQRILDIGTGTGLLALMCAQRNHNATIDAVDIESSAVMTAQLNVANSDWSERIMVAHADITKMGCEEPFDAIICNPPYFNSGEQTKLQSRATARHTDTLSHQDLLKCCQSLLLPHGKASFVLPVVEGEHFIQLAEQAGFSLSRLCKVQPTPTKPDNRLLIELSLISEECKNQHVIIRDKLGYTEAFIALTKDFYLKM
ncbi:tRNA1(Val) (adenine(37)-N6)-methyltransferase [Vibrio renipiscarius]|uniref:tRNA1(Val) (adenine(37)-N6)-methyltransferase n=1 Tax=Vibrio renipiscarius TaxID=1461322 RepID=UPI003551584C